MTIEQVEFRVKRMTKVKFDDYLLGANLRRKPSESSFVGVSWGSEGELKPKLLSQRLFQSKGGLIIKFGIKFDDAVCSNNILLWERLHSDQKPATLAFRRPPSFRCVDRVVASLAG